MDISEKRFERDIEAFFISKAGGYQQFNGQDSNGNWVHSRQLDITRCIYLDALVDFVEKSQPKAWEKYRKYYGDNAPGRLYTRLEEVISEKGLIFVLKNGIEDLGIKIKLCFFRPETSLNEESLRLYDSNILGCSRQFRYSPDNNNTIDMVLSLNGIPIVALELKDQLKGQNYINAINQYRTDRSSKEFCFRRDHRFLVYFAVDLSEVWMTTELKDKDTYFMPFNQGSSGAGNPGGAGNPVNSNGYDTYYLWEEVLQRDSLIALVHRFISHVKEKEDVVSKNGKTRTITKEKMLFPRYHQYHVVKSLVSNVKHDGPGTNYLISHSAGSGKSNSIAWIAYRLASLHDSNDEQIFNSVIVVTNRIVLDNQLQDTINSFDHIPGLVEAIDDKKHSRDLATAINDGKRIIICTIQKFLFAYKDMERFSGRTFAIIIDEAHQGQSGESARSLRRSLIDLGIAVREYAELEGIEEDEVDLESDYVNAVLGQGHHSNQSFFAFTATPVGETLEIFGTFDPQNPNKKIPFHTYSMRQAIEERYILDVLSNYCTIKEAFQLVKVSKDDPELFEGPAYKALIKYYKQHGFTIAQKTEMILANFTTNCIYQIDGKGKAMIVADSRANAVRYFIAIQNYRKEHPELSYAIRPCIAFSDEITLEEYPDSKFSEVTMNRDEEGHFITTDKKFRKAFHSDLFNIMVVANKYQTGFDEPLLHSMFIDKKLHGVAAVQTLSRLNRTCSNKAGTFVLDFENTEEDIKKAFAPFYENTELEGGTNINKVYNIRNKIQDYMLYNHDDVCTFVDFMKKYSGQKQDSGVVGRMVAILQPVVDRYNQLEEVERYAARDFVRRFNNAYSYVTQLIALHDEELFNEYLYTSQLIKLLPKDRISIEDITDKVKLEYASLEETFRGSIILDDKPPVFVPKEDTGPVGPNKKRGTLQSVIDKINERFNGNFSDSDRVIVEGIFAKFMSDPDVKKFKKYAKSNSTEMFVNSLFPDKFKNIVTECFLENNTSFEKLFNDPDFYNQVKDAMAKELYKSLRKD